MRGAVWPKIEPRKPRPVLLRCSPAPACDPELPWPSPRRGMAALCARLATACRARIGVRGGSSAAPLAPPARAPAAAPCRRRDVATCAVTTADALSGADGSGGVGSLADAALQLAASVLAGIPASVALDEVADREGQRVRALSNAQTADGVRLYVAHPVNVKAGEPAPVVVLIHQARPRAVQHALARRSSAQRDALARAAPQRLARAWGVDGLSRGRCRFAGHFPLMPANARTLATHPRADAPRCAQFYGLRERETALCDELARLVRFDSVTRGLCARAADSFRRHSQGCVAVAPDVFQGKSTAWVPRALTLVGRATLGASGDWGAADLASVLRWVDAQPWGADAPLGVAGFCFGGGAALRFAEAHPGEVDAVASFYGAPLADLGRLHCPVFAAYGTADTQFPPAVVDRFENRLSAEHVDATVLRFEARLLLYPSRIVHRLIRADFILPSNCAGAAACVCDGPGGHPGGRRAGGGLGCFPRLPAGQRAAARAAADGHLVVMQATRFFGSATMRARCCTYCHHSFGDLMLDLEAGTAFSARNGDDSSLGLCCTAAAMNAIFQSCARRSNARADPG